MWYIFINSVLAALVLIDGSKRMAKSPPMWALATFLLGPVALSFYLAKRHLLADEIRRGGYIWNVTRYFLVFWTAFVASIVISELFWMNAHDAIMNTIMGWAGLTVSTDAGIIMHLQLWLIPTIAMMLLTLPFRRSSRIEIGPTGPLAWWVQGEAAPSRGQIAQSSLG